MHVRTLEIFCSVVEERSFSKAAAAHDLTQSAVSQAMQQLEESLGVKLIDRSQRPLGLTAAGETYFKGLRGLLRKFHLLEQEVRSVSEQLRGQLTIGTIYSVGLSYIPEAKQVFKSLHPEVTLCTEFGSCERVVEMTSNGECDLGLVSFPRNTKHLQFVPWQQEPMRLVCSESHPLASRNVVPLADLQGVEMVGFDRGLLLRRVIDQNLTRAGVKVKVVMEFDNADSMVRAIQASHGIGIVPEAVVRRETANGSLKVVACRELQMTRPLGIVFRRSGRLSRAANEFGSLLLGRPLAMNERNKSGSRKLAIGDEHPTANGVSVVA